MSVEMPSNTVANPVPQPTGEVGGNNLTNLFSDTKHMIHVAIEIILLGAMFYYSKSSNTALRGQIDVLQDQIDDQKNELDKMKTTISHLTDTISKLTETISNIKSESEARVTSLAPPPRQSIPQRAPVQQTQLPPPVQQTQLPPPVQQTQLPPPVQQTQLPPPVQQTQLPPPVQQTQLPPPVPESTQQVPTVEEYNSGTISIDDELADELGGLN